MNVLGNDRNSSLLGGMMKEIAVCFFAALFTVGLQAETPCPANIKPVRFHNSRQHQMIVQVSINDAGPYDFLLDTGTQMTVVDRSLAAELGLPTSGNAIVAGISFEGQIKFAHLEMVKLGEYASTNRRVLVYDMNKLQRARFAIRGLLGQDFLSGFNVFIDNTHSVLCIDDTGAMEASVKGGLQGEAK
jgi:predicted aspartyl protease